MWSKAAFIRVYGCVYAAHMSRTKTSLNTNHNKSDGE
jgi:hypothetical protein